MSDFNKRCERIQKYLTAYSPLIRTSGAYPALRLTPTYWHIQYLQEAIESFKNKQFIASIVLSSALIETCLCWEHFRSDPKYQVAGTVLPERTPSLGNLFKIHSGTKIPLELLLDSYESLETPNETHYIQTRNKFAHADVLRYLNNPSLLLPNTEKEWKKYGISKEEYMDPYSHNRGLENLAYVHMIKTLKFLNEFENYLRDKYKHEWSLPLRACGCCARAGCHTRLPQLHGYAGGRSCGCPVP